MSNTHYHPLVFETDEVTDSALRGSATSLAAAVKSKAARAALQEKLTNVNSRVLYQHMNRGILGVLVEVGMKFRSKLRCELPKTHKAVSFTRAIPRSRCWAILDGVEGSAAAIVCVNGTDTTAIVRLAAADKPLSPGRSEWTGLLLVLCIVRRVQAHATLRLDNLQAVSTFSDCLARYEHNWLRKNDRHMAPLAWELSAERERRGLGTLTVLHQLGHPEERMTPAQYDTHDSYNVRIDAATHRIKPDKPLYISFRRMSRQNTQLWHEPLEEENVGHGTAHEVTGDSYRHTHCKGGAEAGVCSPSAKQGR